MKNTTFQPGKRGINQRLGERQTTIMEYLWRHGPQTPSELHAGLSRKEDLAYTTVFTELSRMLKKGLVLKAGHHPEVRYDASANREDFVAAMVADVMGGLLQSHGAAAIHGFLDIVSKSDKHADDLAKALRQIRRKKD